jgi:hypothetical protein
MKQLFLLISIIALFEPTAEACDCNFTLNTFCKALQATNDKCIVARVFVEERTSVGANLRILNLYKGDETQKRIQVWGILNGAGCIDGVRSVGTTFIMILWRVEVSYPPLNAKVGDYLTGSICVPWQVLVENGKIIGPLTTDTSQTVDDTDPKRLSFCPNFKTDLDLLENITVAPNPTNNILNFNSLTSDTHIEIFDVLGRLIQQKTVVPSLSFINVADLASGLYIIRFKKNAAVHSVKFIKV